MRFALLLLSLLLPLPALGQAPPVLALEEFAGLKPEDRPQAARFLAMNLPRVFAVGPNGAFGWQSRGGTPEEVEQGALQSCQRRSQGAPCRVAVRDLAVELPGREWRPTPPPAQPAIGGGGWEVVPDANFLWWGPAAGRGVLLFGHGRSPGGADSRGNQPQNWTRHFNNAGYDIWRFDRHPGSDDALRAAGWLRTALVELRARGYRHVVVAGQSRGGWNALMVLDRPGLADVHIAIAPAAHGDTGSPNHLRQNDELRSIVAGAAGAARARVAVANFRNDGYDADPDRRAVLLHELGAKSAGFLFIDRPERPVGHGGGGSADFSFRFGPCLLRFATAPTPPTGC